MKTVNHIPLDLMQTFIKIVEFDGDASAAAQALQISQPTISKRLAALKRIVGTEEGRAWLMLKGKRWLLTPAGERVRGVVAELVRQYETVEQFIEEGQNARGTLAIACGQTAASGFVREAVEQLLSESPDVTVRIATPRGRSRIEGVAGGQFDMAIVTDNETVIRDVAGIELYIEPLHYDRFVVVANPPSRAPWNKTWDSLPVRRPVTAKEIADFPLILPEPDASRRRQFDRWFGQANNRSPNVILEAGGWMSLLQFVHAGIGVGFATEQAVAAFDALRASRSNVKPSLVARYLDEKDFPPDQVRLIARKPQGQDSPDFGASAQRLQELLRRTSRGGGGGK
jgi:LysR family transcriptional regulator, positive regulator for ilvC